MAEATLTDGFEKVINELSETTEKEGELTRETNESGFRKMISSSSDYFEQLYKDQKNTSQLFKDVGTSIKSDFQMFQGLLSPLQSIPGYNTAAAIVSGIMVSTLKGILTLTTAEGQARAMEWVATKKKWLYDKLEARKLRLKQLQEDRMAELKGGSEVEKEGGTIVAFFGGILASLGKVLMVVGSFFGGFKDGVKLFYNQMFRAMKFLFFLPLKIMSFAGNLLTGGYFKGEGFKALKDSFNLFFLKLKTSIGLTMDIMMASFRDTKFYKFFAGIGSKIMGVMNSAAMSKTLSFFAGIGSKISGAMTYLGSIISPLIESMKTFAKSKNGLRLLALGTSLGKWLAWPLTILFGLYYSIIGAFSGFRNTDGTFFEKLIGSILGAFEKLISGMVMELLDVLKDMTSWLLDKIGLKSISRMMDKFSFVDTWASIMDAIGYITSYMATTVRAIAGGTGAALMKALPGGTSPQEAFSQAYDEVWANSNFGSGGSMAAAQTDLETTKDAASLYNVKPDNSYGQYNLDASQTVINKQSNPIVVVEPLSNLDVAAYAQSGGLFNHAMHF